MGYSEILRFLGRRMTAVLLFGFFLQTDVSIADSIEDKNLQFTINGNRVKGTFHMLKQASGEIDAPVLFIFKGKISEDGKDKTVVYRVYSKNNPPFYSVVHGDRDLGATRKESFKMDKRRVISGEMKTFINVKRIGNSKPVSQRIINERGGLISEWALLDIVTTLAFDRNKVFRFNMLDMSAMSKREDLQILYQGQFGKTKTHKFVRLRSDGVEESSYWLDHQHNLIRVLEQDQEWKIVSKSGM